MRDLAVRSGCIEPEALGLIARWCALATTPVRQTGPVGKHFCKADRLGGMLARELAVRAVGRGLAHEALVTLGYSPGCDRPVDIQVLADG